MFQQLMNTNPVLFVLSAHISAICCQNILRFTCWMKM